MENKTSIFAYNGNNITFKSDNGIMVNATQMALPFGKKSNDWLKTQSTQEFIRELSEVRKINSPDLVQVIYGDGGGTWMHEDVAVEFARWLSPKFAIWCNDKVKELMQNGVAVVNDDDDTIARAMNILQNRLDAKQRELAQAKEVIAEQAPKVAFTDAVLASQSSCLIGELAKIITQNGVEIGEKRLFKWMRTNGYLGSKGDRYNIPMQRYIEQGLFELKKGIRSGNNGVMHTTITTKVKPKGQLYFVNKFLNK